MSWRVYSRDILTGGQHVTQVIKLLTGKKLSVSYFFDDIIDYVKINTERDIKNDFDDNYFNEIYVILEDKIRLNSFTEPLVEYT
ncbi:DEHA2D09878p [Debaryomyces hansenii CBS767]|jgi:hypothetical protein|uniref:DEHA2D09878p n=1 Tax=Debaryomyces hansenii (strain ATCC 36239 / CBS 767 / BCRC 21394 / JCM 1990 / NBRC 0083 / IGC 2968) TaxID=284592 RepID=Q6BSC5_DEBHA|nr:DEHA2D09878p [Debaryomyces hansenii CBS767]CAG87048.1 DEHA2D09878p [Debaryomyces hansenii CBS767]|eukprot:XP_458895.1 DEHA2D09878p [Debaryomyces hansenii CBS767]